MDTSLIEGECFLDGLYSLEVIWTVRSHSSYLICVVLDEVTCVEREMCTRGIAKSFENLLSFQCYVSIFYTPTCVSVQSVYCRINYRNQVGFVTGDVFEWLLDMQFPCLVLKGIEGILKSSLCTSRIRRARESRYINLTNARLTEL